MKKKLIRDALLSGIQTKMWKIMRLNAVFLFVCMTHAWAISGYSQETRLTLKMSDSKIIEVLDKIEEQSEFFFLFNQKLVDVERKVDIDVQKKTIDFILQNLFAGTNVNHMVIDRQIVLTTFDEEAFAEQQQPAVSGTVTDESGQPLPGVTVVVQGTTQGTVTNNDGNYSLTNIPEDATLQFSFVGMRTQEILVGNQTSINIEMVVDAIGIEEVVAIGYGTQKKVNLTGAVSTISSDELTKRPVANVAQQLQGKLAGVNIISNSGQPGNETISINIRGINSFGTSNNPIVLIDGVEGNINNLDPDNVASVSVLKDASSAAIYGSRAANGVVLITTNIGKTGTFSVKYHGNYAIHQPTRISELVNDPVEYMKMFNIASENSGLGVSYPDDIIQQYQSGQIKGYNWDDAVYKNPFVHKHNLAVTGGSKKIKFNASFGYLDQDGVVIGSTYKKYNARFSIDVDINKYISFGTNIGVVHGVRKDTYYGAIDHMLSIYASPPTFAPTLPDGKPVKEAFFYEYHNKNPVMVAEYGGTRENSNHLNGKTYLKITPVKGLTWNTTAALKFDHSYIKRQEPFTMQYNYITEEPRGYYGVNRSISVEQPFENFYTLFSTLDYQTTINENHNFKFFVGYSQESFSHNYLNGYRKGLPNAILNEINAASVDGQAVSGSSSEWALQSFFGRLNYNYKGKYLAEVNIRHDGSSRFNADNRWGVFPSFSAGWRISEEGFTEDLIWLSNFKIRASYGKLGNQLIGNYPYQSTYDLGYGYPFGGEITSGTVQTSLANENITWETTQITDVGFDLNIHNGLFSLTFDYFDKTTKDILRGAQIMGHVGLSAPTINGGEMKNTGFDFLAAHRNNLGDFSYNVGLTFSKYKNELTRYGAESIGGWTIRREGLPLDSWYMLEFDGIFQSQEDIDNSPVHYYTPTPGDIKLKDQDGDGDVDMDDRVVMAGRNPNFSYGITINMQWKNFDLSAFIQGIKGATNFVREWGIEPFIQGSRPPVKWRDAWSPENPTNELPKLYFGLADTNNRQISSFYLQNASYARLKNLQIGYNVPLKTNVGIKGLRFYISGDNLFTLTKFEGIDPERSVSSSSSLRFAIYPQVRVLSSGVKVTF